MADVHRVFVHGTLLDDACVGRVTGRLLPRRRARLPGHRRAWPHDGHAALVPDAAAVVEGDVLEEVDAAALAALHAYEDEGRLYARESVVVSVDGADVLCWIYRALFAPAETPGRASGA